MHNRQALGLVTILALAILPARIGAQQQQNNQQNRRDQERQSQQQQRDIQALVQLVDAVAAGKQPAPTDISVMWEANHFVRGADATYIPFSIALNAPSAPVALYVRAVSKAAAPAPAPAQNNRGRDQQQAPMYPWDDVQFLTVPADGKVARALMLKPGEYDLFVAVKEQSPAQPQRNQPPAKSGMLRHSITVPDFGGDQLMVSTPIVATNVEPLKAPLSADEMKANPYVFGGTLRVVPSLDRRLAVSDDFQLVFWIYGAQHNNGVPDLQVDYNFHQKTGDAEKFFNKTAPQLINSTTLPPGFSIPAGHQVLGFLGVPLKSFAPGDYRLEFKVTDKISGKTLTENVQFTVTS
jgi:hypothetical protein